ncbi:MAG: porin, partial [Planctomycetota bacterium]
MARAALGRPDLLVLDEVEAHLDDAANERLLSWIADYDGIVVAATHDSRWVARADQVIDVRYSGVSKGEHCSSFASLGLGALALLGSFLTQAGEPTPSVVGPALAEPAKPTVAFESREYSWMDPLGILKLRHDKLLSEVGPIRYDVDKWSFRLNGRLHVDTADFDSNEVVVDDTTDIRRGRLAYQVRYDNAWRALVDYEYLGVFPGFRNTYLRYSKDDLRVTLGHQLPPFGLEEQTSSNELPLLERSLVQAITPGFQIGGAIQLSSEDGQVACGVFGDPLDQAARTLGDGISITARATGRAMRFDGPLPGQLHLGAAVEQRHYDDGEQVRFRTFPEARLSDERLLTTGRLDGVDSSTGFATELIFDRGPVGLQAEWILRQLNGAGDPLFQGGYVQLSTYLTGEHRRYSVRRGTIRPPRPEKRFGELELVARYSWLDLEDGEVTGGEQVNASIGLNWQVGRNWRYSVAFVNARARPDSSGDPVDLDVLQARVRQLRPTCQLRPIEALTCSPPVTSPSSRSS